MADAFSRHHFVVVNSPRLDYRDSRRTVVDFLDRRLRHYGVRSWELVPDRAAVDGAVQRALGAPSAGIEWLVVSDLLNPIPDMALVAAMTAMLDRTGAPIALCEGAVPGTEVDAVVSARGMAAHGVTDLSGLAERGARRPTIRWPAQAAHNNQLNVFKYKRLKLFLRLVDLVPTLHELTVDDLIATLATDEVFHVLVRFGEDVRLGVHERCPHCGGALHALRNTMSQPFCGFVPSSRPLYHECEGCGLVVQSPYVHADDVHKVYDEWDKRDFVVSTNNPYTAGSPRCDFTKLRSHLPPDAHTLDLGGGIGRFSQFLAETNPGWHVTHSDFALKAHAEAGVHSRVLDFTREAIGESAYHLITAWEVVEHVPVERLGFVMDNIARALVSGGFFVFSTPDFDSPACRSYDFFALCPPFHYTVLSESWLRSYFADSDAFEVVDVRHNSDFLDDALNWYGYGSRTCPSMALRNTSVLLRSVFALDDDRRLRDQLTQVGLGTELIMTLRKRGA